MLHRKPGRRARVERPAEIHLENIEDSWAVSYSDLLMVMMCFFIIFYSVDPPKPSQVEKETVEVVPTVSPVEEHLEKVHQSILDKLKVQDLAVNAIKVEDGVEIDFPDDIYKLGEFRLEGNNLKLFDMVLASIKEMGDDVSVYFVGHTDSKKLRNKNKFLSSNHGLSTLRATAALEEALKNGLPPTQIFAQGGASNSRNSRTLSIKIQARDESKVEAH